MQQQLPHQPLHAATQGKQCPIRPLISLSLSTAVCNITHLVTDPSSLESSRPFRELTNKLKNPLTTLSQWL